MNKKEISILLKFVEWLRERGVTIQIKLVYEFFAYMQSQEK